MTPNPVNVIADDQFNLTVEFDDGELRRVGIKTFLLSPNAIKTNLSLFRRAFIEDGAVISWPNGISIDPELVYLDGERVEKFPATGSFVEKVRTRYRNQT